MTDHRVAATATVLVGADRAVIWPRIVELHPFFADHAEAAAPREIAVVELSPTVTVAGRGEEG